MNLEPDVARAARWSSPAGHWFSAFVGIHPQTQNILQQHGETEISVDDIWCHQWLTNQIAEKHLCTGDMSSPAYVKYLSLTPHMESLQCLHVGDQEGPCFCSTGLKVIVAKDKTPNMGARDPPSTIKRCTSWRSRGVLGSKQSSNGYCRPDVRRRMGLAGSVMNSLQRVCKPSSLSINTEVHLYQALVMSVLL